MTIEDIRNFLDNDLIKQLKYNGIKPALKAFNKPIINKIKSLNIPLSIFEIFYLLKHKDNLENLHIFCPVCGNKNKLINGLTGYHIHCSVKCLSNDQNIKDHISISKLNNIDSKGLNSIQRGAIKTKNSKLNDIDENGLNNYQRSSKKGIITAKNNIDEFGRNSYERGVIKTKRTKKERHNDPNWNNRSQAEQTTYEKTGFKYISQTKEWKDKMSKKFPEIDKSRREKNRIKYGNEIYAKSEHRFLLDPNHKNFKDINEQFFRDNFIINEFFDVEKCRQYFGVQRCWVYKYKKKFNIIEKNLKNNSSKPQSNVYDFIKSIYSKEIQYGTFKIIPPKELDIYLPDVNLAIEFNGIYWHSLKVGKDKYYHQNKLKACLAKGIRLIHIWEDEWNDNRKQEIIKNIIKRAIGLDTKTVENIKIDKISEKQYEEFCNKYNLEGYKKADIKLGLFDNNKLIQVLALTLKEQCYTIITNCYNFELYRDYTKELIEYFQLNHNKRKLHVKFHLKIESDEIQTYLDYGFKILSLSDHEKRKLENHTVFDSGVFTLFI